jgi:hypothetical protein
VRVGGARVLHCRARRAVNLLDRRAPLAAPHGETSMASPSSEELCLHNERKLTRLGPCTRSFVGPSKNRNLRSRNLGVGGFSQGRAV